MLELLQNYFAIDHYNTELVFRCVRVSGLITLNWPHR
jgi:hypothetical protein